jgi:TetR/AcrR family transcriptional regulator, cholesterol catabolism regulator
MAENVDFKGSDKILKKQLIVDAAVQIFHEKGYHAATLDDVAHVLGVTKAALYNYVSSKQNLLSVIYIQALESFFAEGYEIGESDLAPPEKMRVLIRHHIKHVVIDNLSMFGVFFSEENQLPEPDFQTIRKEKRKYTRVFEDIIEAGIEGNFFRPTDPKLHASAIIGMCNWLYRWYRPDGDFRTPDEIADHFLDLLENGYLKVGRDGASGEGAEFPPTRKRHVLDDIKGQAQELIRRIEELEKLI